ncbi:DUF4433 domain-containing protein [Mycobacterium intracellulare]|uniref:DarT ssDNA thymidine ADP-ribosyltransferase family protein n=1 Tax=Mycobacterium intracellulare TaxID=1767 RepID=UPI001CDA653F|nr:DarT ssDNA thymidine ADP-ribosyltransferase family protein [Mycobacterium intracellulare]MCA2253869.1 DUF4433 domain-containing protein [Mycobacterium intracellulare]
MTSPTVVEALASLPLTRIVHFTPASNLWGMFRDRMVRTADDLEANSASYSATDPERVDNHPGHTCCSFEYPAVYYLRIARRKVPLRNYPDWVGLILKRDLVARPGALFAPCNAAKASGAYLAEGGQALLNCWANPSNPGNYPRLPNHHPAAPTDLQSEVLIPGPIDFSELVAIVAPTAAQVQTIYGFLASQDLHPESVQWRYSPMFFDPIELPRAIQNGHDIPESVWVAPEGTP